MPVVEVTVKSKVVSYIVQSGNLWVGVDIYNPLPYAVAVQWRVYRNSNGYLAKEVEDTIEPKGHLILGKEELLSNDPEQRSTLEVDGPSTLMVSATHSAFGMLPVYEYQGVYDESREDMVLVEDKLWMHYYGSSFCPYLFKRDYNVLSRVAQSLYNEYPYRNDRILVVGDASTTGTTQCQGHPGASHSKCNAVDLDYYTYDTNSTQYGDNKTIIWNGGELSPIFDVERNAEICLRIKSLVPSCTISTNEDIKEKLIEYNNTLTWVHGDPGTTYNHHTHFHIDF